MQINGCTLALSVAAAARGHQEAKGRVFDFYPRPHEVHWNKKIPAVVIAYMV